MKPWMKFTLWALFIVFVLPTILTLLFFGVWWQQTLQAVQSIR